MPTGTLHSQPAPSRSRPHTRLRTARLLTLSALLALLLLALPAGAWAHPLGNFSVNRYSRLEVGPDAIQIFYVLDMAEIPTHTARTEMDADGDGQVSQAEAQAHAAALFQSLQQKLWLKLDGVSTPLTPGAWQVTFPEGQAGLPTLRLEAHLSAPVPYTGQPVYAVFGDDNYADRLGWQEMVAVAAHGAQLVDSSVPGQDVTHELRVYPTDLLSNPLATRVAEVRFTATGAAISPAAALVPPPQTTAQTGAATRAKDPFADLINIPTLGPSAVLLALLLAFGWGAAHAFSPGHGKTIVGAYLVGSRGTPRHALFLGLTTTVTHTAGVFVLGFITLAASEFILPETLFPWLSVLSGLLVVSIGLSVAWGRVRAWRIGDVHHDHDHDHTHVHDHLHSHTHGAHGHSHLPPGTEGAPGMTGAPVTWRGLLLLGVSGGLLPCPSALVVMLGAIALQRVGFGLLLITIFSVGLASVLTLIGIAMIYAGKLFTRIPERGLLLKLLPAASAILITVIGVGITLRALQDMGLL